MRQQTLPDEERFRSGAIYPTREHLPFSGVRLKGREDRCKFTLGQSRSMRQSHVPPGAEIQMETDCEVVAGSWPAKPLFPSHRTIPSLLVVG